MSNIVDILVRSKDETKAGFDSAGKSASSFGSKAAKASKVATAGLLAMGGAAVVATLKAEEVASANARVANVLDNMGMAGATDRVLEYAESLEQSLGVDEKVIKTTQAKLATFSELAKSADETGGAFDRATMAAVDMAAAGFGTAESNAVQLGKALQDPVKGITALNKSGVTFTEQQKEQIATLVESGKSAKAQELILAELEKQVGGTAEATGDSSAKMKLAFGEVVETLGASLLPHMDKLAAIVQKSAEFITNHSGVVMVGAGVLAGLAVAVITVNLAMKAYTAVTKAAAVAQKVLNAVMRANPIGLVITAVLLLVTAIVILWKRSETFRNIWKAVWGAVSKTAVAAKDLVVAVWNRALDFFSGLPGRIGGALRSLGSILTTPFRNAVTVVRDVWGNVLDFFGSLPRRLGGVMSGAASAISAPFRAAFDGVRSLWNSTVGGFGFSIPDWVPKIGGKSFTIPSMASGGIVGGLGGGLTMVGERGREIVQLPTGSRVLPNGQAERMLAGGGGSGVTVLVDARGALDPVGIGREIERVLAKYVGTTGQPLQVRAL